MIAIKEYRPDEIKELLKLYIEIIETKRKNIVLMEKGKTDEAIELVDGLIDRVPQDSLLFLEMLAEYDKLEARDRILNKVKDFEYHSKEPFFNLLISRA